jgi:AraC-like DNA-binding protein
VRGTTRLFVYTLSFAEDELAAATRRLGLPDACADLKTYDEIRLIDRKRINVLCQMTDDCIARNCTSGLVFLPEGPGQRIAVERLAEQLILILSKPETVIGKSSRSRLTATTSRALEYIEAHLSEGMTVKDLSMATGLSRRTLEYSFQKQFETSPKSFINKQRFILVRREFLRSSGEKSIAEISNRWGFWHMGQFAKDYRKQFSELPSETIRSSRWSAKRARRQ